MNCMLTGSPPRSDLICLLLCHCVSQTFTGEPVCVAHGLLLLWEVLEDSRMNFVSTWILNFPASQCRFLPVPGSSDDYSCTVTCFEQQNCAERKLRRIVCCLSNWSLELFLGNLRISSLCDEEQPYFNFVSSTWELHFSWHILASMGSVCFSITGPWAGRTSALEINNLQTNEPHNKAVMGQVVLGL